MILELCEQFPAVGVEGEGGERALHKHVARLQVTRLLRQARQKKKYIYKKGGEGALHQHVARLQVTCLLRQARQKKKYI